MESSYEKKRNRNHFLTQLHCDLCHFGNMWSRELDMQMAEDDIFMVVIQRSSMDYFWNRYNGTFRVNLPIIKSLRFKAK